MLYVVLLFFSFIIFTSLFLILAGYYFSKRRYTNFESLSAYECGFQPKSGARVPFALQFYLAGIIYLLFDVELVLTLALLASGYSNSFYLVSFFFFLLGGVMHEANEGGFTWRS